MNRSREAYRLNEGFWQAAEKLDLSVVFGGAALQRCDNGLVFSASFSRCGQTAAPKTLFRQPPWRTHLTMISTTKAGFFMRDRPACDGRLLLTLRFKRSLFDVFLENRNHLSAIMAGELASLLV